ncbi:MAG: hypothetical protein IJQ85_00760 [Selenomonadaceae bacterium]|nr:hypothetical protein [Selenomonadaceae bacterium]
MTKPAMVAFRRGHYVKIFITHGATAVPPLSKRVGDPRYYNSNIVKSDREELGIKKKTS